MRSLIPEEKVTKLFRRNYVLQGVWIKPDPSSAELEPYNPFDFYQSPTNLENDTRISASPHLEFANLDIADEREITAFCSKWGLLGAISRDFLIAKSSEEGNTVNVPVDKRAGNIHKIDEFLTLHGCDSWEEYITCIELKTGNESLEIFKYYCQYFQALVQMKNALVPYSEENILKLKKTWNHPVRYFRNLDLTSDNAEELAAQFTLALAFSMQRELVGSFGVVPFFEPIYKGDIVKELNFSTVWTCDSLLTAMFLMLHLDLTQGTYTVKCKKCRHWFETKNKRAEYCTKEHQDAAKSARRYEKYKVVINEKRRKKGGDTNG